MKLTTDLHLVLSSENVEPPKYIFRTRCLNFLSVFIYLSIYNNALRAEKRAEIWSVLRTHAPIYQNHKYESYNNWG